MEAGTAEGEQAIRRLAEALEMKGAIIRLTSRLGGAVVWYGSNSVA
jgi:hypothetical protein